MKVSCLCTFLLIVKRKTKKEIYGNWCVKKGGFRYFFDSLQ